jgi:hypothetical protein
MWRHVDGAQLRYAIGAVKGLVFTLRDTATGLLGFGLSIVSEARRSALPLASVTMPTYRQPMPVLHCGVAHIAEPGFATGSFAVKPTVGIGCARRVSFLLCWPWKLPPPS